jgi:hypothetical protein
VAVGCSLLVALVAAAPEVKVLANHAGPAMKVVAKACEGEVKVGPQLTMAGSPASTSKLHPASAIP